MKNVNWLLAIGLGISLYMNWQAANALVTAADKLKTLPKKNA